MKKLLIGVVSTLLVAALAVPAFAATLSDNSKKEISDLYGQIAALRKQIVQQYVDEGLLTKTEGDQIKENIDKSTKYQQENSANPDAGFGCGGGGGMMGSYGGMMGGYGGMMGGYTNSDYSVDGSNGAGSVGETI